MLIKRPFFPHFQGSSRLKEVGGKQELKAMKRKQRVDGNVDDEEEEEDVCEYVDEDVDDYSRLFSLSVDNLSMSSLSMPGNYHRL